MIFWIVEGIYDGIIYVLLSRVYKTPFKQKAEITLYICCIVISLANH